MDVQREGDGHWRFQLGPVEKWICAAIASAFVVCAYWMVSAVQTLTVQQAVTITSIAELNRQLSDVPSMTKRLAEHEVRIKRLEDDTRELREMKDLR